MVRKKDFKIAAVSKNTCLNSGVIVCKTQLHTQMSGFCIFFCCVFIFTILSVHWSACVCTHTCECTSPCVYMCVEVRGHFRPSSSTVLHAMLWALVSHWSRIKHFHLRSWPVSSGNLLVSAQPCVALGCRLVNPFMPTPLDGSELGSSHLYNEHFISLARLQGPPTIFL